jgi:hypothetical protein
MRRTISKRAGATHVRRRLSSVREMITIRQDAAGPRRLSACGTDSSAAVRTTPRFTIGDGREPHGGHVPRGL